MTDLRSSVRAFPLLAEASALAEDGKLDQAAQRVIVHLRQHPDEPRGLVQLGTIAMQLGALGQAEQFLRRGIMRGAADVEVRRNLASILNQQERLGEAAAMFEALARETSDPAMPAIRAIVLDKLGRSDEALALREALARAHPDQPQHWISYGHSLRSVGRVEEAIEAYRKAIAADFEFGEAWWGLASIKRRVFTDADIAEMRRAIGIAIDVRHSAPLHFALARALHDRGEYAEAFTHYATGNRQRAESIGYDSRELTTEVDEVVRSVDGGFLARMAGGAAAEATPVFIVCLPRSGSTLLEQMLGSHPSIEPVGELPYIPAILRSVMEMATRRSKVTVPQLIAGIDPDQAAAIGRDYLARAALHRKTDRPFFVDKLPHNWSNILFIRRILPQARFLDIRRAPMDCCFSNFTQSFSSAHASSFALEDIGQCYADYVRLMGHLDRVAPGLVHHIRYERLIEDAETHLRAALDYLGLPWDPAVLEFHKLDRVVRTPSSEQVRRPLNRDGVDVWAPYSEWLDPLRKVLGPLADGQD
ncbi:sulfotransferase [Sphingomonas canadensis]|uniref:Sulfotransferase n=1 Tax=Sphingomonas canadensis TaxID=1219257 RepID=A0ABW3H9L0_9SPHN|nr:tetratricopeptide repeat-containing sulfotransferase family protein [Sphingomonas canadensis]MCW3837877.1 sulfotransferase [Sphingomonas canadensis]